MSRSLLSAGDLNRGEAIAILDTAKQMHAIQTREVKKLPPLRGRTIVNLFFEDSTRTRSSFEIAGQVALGRRHQRQRQGLERQQGREPARHRR